MLGLGLEVMGEPGVQPVSRLPSSGSDATANVGVEGRLPFDGKLHLPPLDGQPGSRRRQDRRVEVAKRPHQWIENSFTARLTSTPRKRLMAVMV